MAKDKSIYTCTECGGISPKWLGKCPSCGAWNTLVESVAEGPSRNRYQSASRGLIATQAVATLSEIEASDVDRQPTGVDELDRVLGGGIVAGGDAVDDGFWQLADGHGAEFRRSAGLRGGRMCPLSALV